MWSVYLDSDDPSQVAEVVGSLDGQNEDVYGVFVVGEEPAYLERLVEGLRRTGRRFFGGVFPEILDGGLRHKRGALILRLPALGDPVVVRQLDQPGPALEMLGDLAAATEHRPTAVVLVDGLAAGISHFLSATYNELGNRVRYWGGGAGVWSFKRQPCLFTKDGVFQDGAILLLCRWSARLGVRHGWREIAGPLVATRTEGNVIRQLNWKNAAEVYAASVSESIGRPMDATKIPSWSASYPLGLKKQGEELVVRDPVAVGEEGSLICVGDVPENAVLSVLTGAPDTLVEAAGQAAKDATPAAGSAVRHCLLADCVSRVGFLGDGFEAELEAIARGLGEVASQVHPCGVLTLGEISSRGDGYLEFFNKTCVVAVLYER